MFGGLAFLVNGHLAVSAGRQGGLLLPVEPAQTKSLLTDPRAQPFVMRGREMSGWLHVHVDGGCAEDELQPWVDRSLGYARTLPPK